MAEQEENHEPGSQPPESQTPASPRASAATGHGEPEPPLDPLAALTPSGKELLEVSLDVLKDFSPESGALNDIPQVSVGKEHTLEACQLNKSYRGRKVVNDVSLTIARGEIVGLLGPNGAGKTTTFYMMVGLVSPDSGNVRMNNQDLTSHPMYVRARRGISYLPQEPSVFRRLSVEDNLYAVAETLELVAGMADQMVSELLEEFGISNLRKHLAYTLSGGERRRLEIARSMMIDPAFILLDEPLAGIDPLAVLELSLIQI